jgi:hypothetical protein
VLDLIDLEQRAGPDVPIRNEAPLILGTLIPAPLFVSICSPYSVALYPNGYIAASLRYRVMQTAISEFRLAR